MDERTAQCLLFRFVFESELIKQPTEIMAFWTIILFKKRWLIGCATDYISYDLEDRGREDHDQLCDIL